MKKTRALRLLPCVLLLLCLTVPCVAGAAVTATEIASKTPTAKTAAPGTGEVTASDPQELLNALKRGAPVICVDDMTFEPGTKLFLNYDVQLIGKKEKSRLENAHIVVSGSNTVGESVSVRLENLVLDGMVDKADYPFDREGLSFDAMFGDERENERCILADWGEIHYTPGDNDYDVTRYVYADKKGGFFFVAAGDWIVCQAVKEQYPQTVVIPITKI